MWTFLIGVAAVIIFAGVSWRESAKRTREAEERARKVRRQAHFALEAELLTKGPGNVWSDLAPDVALRSVRSLGNVGYLVWLLNYEPLYRDHRGEGEDQYPPDWELRRGFVFLRDRYKCQGYHCGAASSLGSGLDCHHIKPISEFRPEEKGIHALGNLVTLCPICHASQHKGNKMLIERAAKSAALEQRRLPNSAARRSTPPPTLSSPGQFDPPRKIEVHSHLPGQSDSSKSEPDRTEKEYRPETETDVPVKAFAGPSRSFSQGPAGTKMQQDAPKAKSITEGLAIVDERAKAADAGLQLDDLEKRLKETPSYRTFERRLLQMQIDNMKNRIRSDHAVAPEPTKVDLEPAKQVLLEAKNATPTDRGRKAADGNAGIPKTQRPSGIPQPHELGVIAHAEVGHRVAENRSGVGRAPARTENEEAEAVTQRRSKWKLSLHTDSCGVVSLDWHRFDAGNREEAEGSEEAHPGLQLEDGVEHGADQLKQEPTDEIPQKDLEEAKNTTTSIAGPERPHRASGTPQHLGVGDTPRPPKVEVSGHAVNKRPGAATICWVVCMKNLEVGKMQLITPDMRIDDDDPRWDQDVHIVPVTEDPRDVDYLTFGVHDFKRDCACHPEVTEQRFGRTIVAHSEKVN